MRNYFAQVEEDFPASKLVDRAREELGLDTDQAIGKFVRLWLATIRAVPGGRLGERSDVWIEEAVAWRGQPGQFAAFVRQWHLDENGVVRDWASKYGALDHLRERARRNQAEKRRRDKLSPPRHGDMGDDTSSDERQHDSGDVGEGSPDFSLTSTSSSLRCSSLEQEKSPRTEKEPVGRGSNTEVDRLIATLEEARLDQTLFAPDDWKFVEGLIRSARNPLSIATIMRGHLEGMDGPLCTPAVLGRAAREFAADGKEFNARYFAAFVGGAEKAMNVRENRQRNKAETRHIDAEEVAKENYRREDAETTRVLGDFESNDPETFTQLRAIAEKSVGVKSRGSMFHQALVRAELLKLVRGHATGDARE